MPDRVARQVTWAANGLSWLANLAYLATPLLRPRLHLTDGNRWQPMVPMVIRVTIDDNPGMRTSGGAHCHTSLCLCLSLGLAVIACTDAAPRPDGAVVDSGPLDSSMRDARGPAADDGAVNDAASDAASALDATRPGANSDASTRGDASTPVEWPDAVSQGGTITFEQIGKTGWYPSRRDPAVGPCDAYDSASCCLAQQSVESDALTPWDTDLVMTLRGPMHVKQLAVYQPIATASGSYARTATWSETSQSADGLSFTGGTVAPSGFQGAIGTECLVNVASDRDFGCGTGSMPYCPQGAADHFDGFRGDKLFVLLASMPHADAQTVGTPCSDDDQGNWYDAPWIGLSLGELVRAGAFSNCQCYAKNPDEWWLGDGCGQLNAFEVVNDNNQYRNLDVFSTNFFGYAGYVGEGPCGSDCDVSTLPRDVDLIDKNSGGAAATGALATPGMGPRAAFRRPTEGYRYFLMLFDVDARTVQLAIVHPGATPAGLEELLPALPESLSRSTIDTLHTLRLPAP